MTTHAKRDLFWASALFLFMELAFIRWFPAEVLFLTFFTNTILLASFLGLSLGCLTASRPTNYLKSTPVILIVAMTAGALMEWVRLALQGILEVGKNATSPQMVYFGTEIRTGDVASFAVPMEWVAGFFFLLVALTMIGPGQLLGRRFAALPNPVEAYIANIGGSLAGVLLFNVCSWWLPPIAWFAIVACGLAYFLWEESPRVWWPVAAAAAVPLLMLIPAHFSLGAIREQFPVESWSPYYRINYSPINRTIVVNLIGHQTMISRNDPSPAYAVPYLLNRDTAQPVFHDILIIGAGSGNDVSRALQWAAPDAHIDAVEIDPLIQKIGKRDNPDHPYQDPRVTVHLNDGRNFLRSTNRRYDLIVFALIDSLVLHSSVSNIRLESYLFTKESMEDVQRHLKPDGLFIMYNYFRQGWIVARLAKTLESVFARAPIVLTMPEHDRIAADEKVDGFTALMEGGRAEILGRAFRDRGPYTVDAGVAPGPSSPDGFEVHSGKRPVNFHPAKVEIPADLRMAEDVWPFLYLRRPMIPDISWRGMAVIGGISLGLLWLFRTRGARSKAYTYDLAMLFLGAGFMLLETKAVVHMALIFGSTWIVNTAVFVTLLIMVLAANLWVLKRSPRRIAPYFFALLGTLAANVAVPLDSFLGLPQLVQAAAAGALVLSPVFCAGVIFATLFQNASHPERAIAYNAAGAILGGLAENASLLVGFQWILALAALIYTGAWLCGKRYEGPGRTRTAGA